MNKYLLLSAASLIATSVRADPAPLAPPQMGGHTQTSFYITIGGETYCNEWTVTRASELYINTESLEACTGYTGVTGSGLGARGHSNNGARYADLPSDLGSKLAGANLVSDFVISLPLRSGGTVLYFYWTAPNAINVVGGNYFLGHPGKSKTLKPPIQLAIAKFAEAHRTPDNK